MNSSVGVLVDVVRTPPLWEPFGFDCLLECDRMRPGVVKSESYGLFLSSRFRTCFDDRAKWVAHLASEFTVGVIDAPKLKGVVRFHGDQ